MNIPPFMKFDDYIGTDSELIHDTNIDKLYPRINGLIMVFDVYILLPARYSK